MDVLCALLQELLRQSVSGVKLLTLGMNSENY